MTHLRPDEIDRRVRGSFRIDPEAVRRVVTGAASLAGSRPRRAWAFRAALAGAVALALLAAVEWWPGAPDPAPTVPESANVPLVGYLTDGVLVLDWPDGSTSIISADRAAERPPDGVGIVLVEGGGK